jgi:4-carboxymuconolactone decarboxylase
MKKTFFVLFISFFTTTMVCVISGGNIMADDRFDRGLKKLEEIDGAAGRNVIQSLQDISPDLARYTIEYPFGDVYMRPGLDLRAREIATIAALTALGNAVPQLKVHINAGLNVGLKPEEITEIILQMSVYAGFPAALNGMFAAKEVFKERKIVIKNATGSAR